MHQLNERLRTDAHLSVAKGVADRCSRKESRRYKYFSGMSGEQEADTIQVQPCITYVIDHMLYYFHIHLKQLNFR